MALVGSPKSMELVPEGRNDMLSVFESYLWRTGFLGRLARFLARSLRYRITVIPDEESVWRSLLPSHYKAYYSKKANRLKAGYFMKARWPLSTDLCRFSTAEASRLGHRIPKSFDPRSGLIKISVINVKRSGGLINHTPLTLSIDRKKFAFGITNNYSHSDTSDPTEAPGVIGLPMATKLIGVTEIIHAPLMDRRAE